GGHAAERPLIDAAVLGARERHAPVLELVDRRRRVAAQVLDRVLVAEPVGSLDGVVHVPAPVVLAHVAERGGDPALRGDGVRAGGARGGGGVGTAWGVGGVATPASLQPTTARSPAPPAPTTTTS